MESSELLSLRENINQAFNSLKKSGRPDISNENRENLLPDLYVDLEDGNYFLNAAMDDNHAIFQGRRGTGKSTIFIEAERLLKENNKILPIYINLQSCYEEIRTSDGSINDECTKYFTHKTFFDTVLNAILDKCKSIFSRNESIKRLFEEIQNGVYMDPGFSRKLSIQETRSKSTNLRVNGIANVKGPSIGGSFGSDANTTTVTNRDSEEIRVYSINPILNKLADILEEKNIDKVYLFLDDFSELDYDSQKLIVDSLISPIVSSYNEHFVVKLAAYPYRIYLGNIDSNKISQYSLDFYDVYEKTADNYKKIEELAIAFVKRTLKKRIEVYTNNQMDSDELFDVSKADLEQYYRRLFYASAGIPRCLGYILGYLFLGSINSGKQITLSNIDSAARDYYIHNIKPDFSSDVRFKQSFHDDKKILSQVKQIKLTNDLIQLAKSFKKTQIDKKKSKQPINEIINETINKYKTSNGYWIPSSHFSIEKNLEKLLETLELYYIVNKYNEGSNKKGGVKMSFYGLNYGLCLEEMIDYGKPDIRRSYDYWRQDEFNYSKVIPEFLRGTSIPKCKKCGHEYADDSELEIAKRFNYCLYCKENLQIEEGVSGSEILAKQMAEWKKMMLPDYQMNILRVLYNYKDNPSGTTASRIAGELDVHHLSITKACDKLKNSEFVDYDCAGIRYYRITEKAIKLYFSDDFDVSELDI